jgi:putative membrane protein
MSDQLPLDVQPSVGNHFAWLRTMMGLQRTLMAAVRTTVSLIGFGFTVAQFFDKMQNKVPEDLKVLNVNTARDLGLVLIGAGVISLGIFLAQYHSSVAYMKSAAFKPLVAEAAEALHRPTYLVAWAVIIIGVAAFGSVFLRF